MSTDMFPDGFIHYMLEEEAKEKAMAETDKDHCVVCGVEIKVQIMKGSGVCGENHRKVRDGEANPERALTHAAEPPSVILVNKGVQANGFR